MATCRTAGVLFALLCAVGVPVGADWAPVGPPGGDVRALAAHPRLPHVVYLGTADGVLYRSDDAGQQWRRLEPGFPLRGHSLDDVVVGPRGEIYVGFWKVTGSGGGVARSDDGGQSFELLDGIAGKPVRGLSMALDRPDQLVAGTPDGVFQTLDGGASWSRISPRGHEGLKNVGSIALDPRDASTIFAGTWHLPWKTGDGGQSWRRVSRGMMKDSDVMTLTLDPRDPDQAFATACSGMYRTRDGGQHWVRLKGVPWSARRTRAFAQSPDDPERYFAGTTEGLWTSADDTRSWRVSTSRQLVVNAIVALPGGIVLLGCDGAGVLRSEDHGGRFAASNRGFSSHFVSQVAFHRSGRIFAVVQGDRHHGGVLTAAHPEGPWSPTGPGLEGRKVLSLAVGEDLLLAGTDDGLFLAAAGGGPWTRLATLVGDRDLHPRATAVAFLDDDTLLAATSGGLLRSRDAGARWQQHDLGRASSVASLAVSADTPGRVVATTALGVFGSEDRGENWQRLASAPELIERIVFVPGEPKTLLAGSSRGLLKSRDGGRSWSPRSRGLPHTAISGLAVAPDGKTVYASDFSFGGLFRSRDAGESWRTIGEGGLTNKRVWTVGVDPRRPDRVVASAPTGGLHVRVFSDQEPRAALPPSASPARGRAAGTNGAGGDE